MIDTHAGTAADARRDAPRPYERDATIHALFARQADATPRAPAVRDERETLSYRELDERANRLAQHLRAAGVTSETPVGIALDRSVRSAIAILAVLKADGAYVPLDVDHPAERLAFVAADAGVSVTLVESATRSRFTPAGIVIDLDAEAASIARRPAIAPPSRAGATSLAYVMYTSGSTGRPKGVACVHRGVVRLVRGNDAARAGAGDVVLQYAPLGFDASTFEIWAALLNGGTLAFAKPGLLAIDELADAVERFGVTVAWLTAPLFHLMVDAGVGRFARLRLLVTGGDVVSPGHAARFLERAPDCRLIDGYGPTENTTFSCWYDVTPAAAAAGPLPIGRPIAHSVAYVLDERGRPVGPGSEGELYVGGDGLARGYVNRPDLTAERFVRDPFANEPGARLYRTGDRVRLRPDGILEFRGRFDLQVKIRGFRVEVEEIEAALRALPDVADAAVVAVGTDTTEKLLVAHVVLRNAQPVDAVAIRRALERRLPQHMIPTRFQRAERLPSLPNGKVDRAALTRSTATHGPAASASPPRGAAPADSGADPILRLWRRALGTTGAPDPDQNFFDAGGDSIRLIWLHKQLQEAVSPKLRLTALFENSTLRKLRAYCAEITR